MRIHSGKCIIRLFHHCSNIIEDAYTNLDSIVCYISRLWCNLIWQDLKIICKNLGVSVMQLWRTGWGWLNILAKKTCTMSCINSMPSSSTFTGVKLPTAEFIPREAPAWLFMVSVWVEGPWLSIPKQGLLHCFSPFRHYWDKCRIFMPSHWMPDWWFDSLGHFFLKKIKKN